MPTSPRASILSIGVVVIQACATPSATPDDCSQRLALANTPDFTGACVDAQTDWRDARCLDSLWQMPACGTTTVIDGVDFGGQHVNPPTAITYTDDPPMSGPHRPQWPNWGEYGFLPKQRWLHSLEHGGVAILYHPCAPADLIDALRSWAQNTPNDEGGPFRWVMTPYPGLDSAFSLVTWRHRLKGNCFDPTAVSSFMTLHYRHAPEDAYIDGGYTCAWIGKSCGSSSTGADAVATADGMASLDAK